jgi:hypothetical protein
MVRRHAGPASARSWSEQDRHEHQPHEQRVEQHRDAEDDPHLLRRQRPGQGEREEHGDHHGAGGQHHAAGVGRSPTIASRGVVAAVPVLLPPWDIRRGMSARGPPGSRSLRTGLLFE